MFKNPRTNLTQTTYANGYTVSVAFHNGAYCDGETTAEFAIFGPDGEFYRLPEMTNDDVIGHLTADDVLALSVRVAAL